MKNFVKFRLNKNLDKKVCFDFLNFKCGGIDFGKVIISTHPHLTTVAKTKSPTVRRKKISEYVDEFYNSHKSELESNLVYFRKEWNKMESDFLGEAKKIFSDFRPSKEKYDCFISIFNCNPRFLENKTFQVFYKNRKEFMRIICHELLHFIFYDYIKKIKLRASFIRKWDIAEILNTILLNQKAFRRIISPSRELGYPAHKKYIKVLTSEWEKCKNLLIWAKRAVKLVSSK